MPINTSMSYRIRCNTLFDITNTGITNRSKPDPSIPNDTWLYKRNTQCNFDTILQIISLRSQPEIVRYPEKIHSSNNIFGSQYNSIYYWSFDFEVHHESVFDNDMQELGAVYQDCVGVPMIISNTCLENMTGFLDISPELKNIHFEKL